MNQASSQDSITWSPRQHLYAALALGLATALTEVLVIALRWNVLHRFVWTGHDMFWMVPLFYAGIFLSFGAVTGLLQWLSRGRLPPAVTTGPAAALATFSLLLLLFSNRIATVALVLLAVGAGVQAGRFTNRHPSGAGRVLRLGGLVVGAFAFLLATGQPLLQSVVKRNRFASLAEAREGAPNVLIIIWDTVRAASLSLYGYERPTTTALADRSRNGAVFDRAHSTTSWTLPSHATMFTGRFPNHLSTGWLKPLDGEHATLAEVLAAEGYRTGGFVANLLYTQRESGLDRGFIHYEDFRRSKGQFLLSTALGQQINEWRTGLNPVRRAIDRKSGDMVTRSFLAWASTGSTHPFFAFLNYYDAHRPYRAPARWRERFESGRQRRDSYDASIAYLDHELDTLLYALDKKGLLENTIVVLASDHGELLGEHGLSGHGNSLYDPLLHVPLVIWYPPAVPSGRRISGTVSLRDLPATLLDLAGLPPALPGCSLVPAMQGGELPACASPALSEVHEGINTPPDEPVTWGPMHSLHYDSWHLIVDGRSKLELFDLSADPEEKHNLADHTGSARRVKEMRQRIQEYRADREGIR